MNAWEVGGGLLMKSHATRAAALAVLFLLSFNTTRIMVAAAEPSIDTRSKALAHYIMGVCDELNGAPNNAIKEFQQSIALNGREALPHLRLAAYYSRLGLLSKAADQLKITLRLDPQNSQAHYLLALVYSSQNKLDLAAQEYEAVLKTAPAEEPQNIEAYLYLAQLYFTQAKYDQAILQFNKILMLQPANVSANYLLGSTYLEMHDPAKAKESFKKVLSAEPEHDGALNSLGYVYAEEGVNLDEALSMARKAVALDPTNGAYHDTLGWVLYKKGMYTEALQALQKAATYVKDPVLYDHLGDAYKAVRDFPQARQFWRKSLEMKPGQPQITRKLQDLEKVHALN